LRAHRRIDIPIRSRDLETGLSRQQRQSTHKGAANTEDMDVM